MLSPQEAAARARGQAFKRYVRAAAALHGLFDDVSLAEMVGRNRAAVGNWWRGAKPEPDVLYQLAEVTGLSADELALFVYSDGPPPTLPEPGSPAASSVEEGLHRDQRHPLGGAPDRPVPTPKPQPRGSAARHG